ncbi:putative membrane protein [Helicobacter pylori SouthAfrica50]|uniref:Putative membrane protein n=1 Tax=Helicobacter pylori SouthAfrica50 TaxID=1352357 RepID=T2S6V2_HELPX|nr:putative membrane protein [Helicobacter pylori SouthAfrica50]
MWPLLFAPCFCGAMVCKGLLALLSLNINNKEPKKIFL